jgi:RNA polymerase-binding transcription factor DksA
MKTKKTNLDLEKFKKGLKSEEASLISEMKKVSQKNPNVANDWEPKSENMDILRADRNEVADKFASFEGDVGILRKLEPQLNDVKLALSKIESNQYGICEICGKPIEVQRLEANPAARTCKKHINERLS